MSQQFALDLGSFSNELKLLLAIMGMERGVIIPESIKALAAVCDWNEFHKLAMHHRVYPTVYSKLKNLDNDFVPNNVLQALREDYNKNTFHMLYLTSEMERVCKIFNDNEIRSIMLKGSVLAVDLYGDISFRTSKDLDILVPLSEVEKAENILLGLGYVKEIDVPRILNDWQWKTHHMSYLNHEKGIEVELHWRLNPDMGKEPAFDELWERRRLSFLTSAPVYLLSNEDLFLYLVSHGARHGWFRVRWLADIDRMIRKSIDWDVVTFIMKKYHSLHMGGQAIILSSQLLNTPINEEVKTLVSGSHPSRIAQASIRFIKDMVVLHPVPTPDIADYYKYYLFSLKSERYKLMYIISRLYPSSFDALAMPLPKLLRFLYFPLRPFLWWWRQIKQS